MNNASTQSTHEVVQDLLPLAVNGRLSAQQQSLLDSHLSHCNECREEYRQLTQLSEHFAASDDGWQPSPAHFATLLQQIDAETQPAVTTRKTSLDARLRHWLSFDWLQPLQVKWAFGLQTAALALVLTIWLLPETPPDGVTDGDYVTLSSAQHGAKNGAATVRILPATTMTVGQLAELMKQCGAEVIGGPSELGLYDLAVPRDKLETALAVLKNAQGIRLVQLDGGADQR